MSGTITNLGAALSDLVEDLYDWSQTTFGTFDERGPLGPIKHLRKECKELLQKPQDLVEWADALILVLDGSRRAGHKVMQLLEAAQAKVKVNRTRVWPKPWEGWVYSEHVISSISNDGVNRVGYQVEAVKGDKKIEGFGVTLQKAMLMCQAAVREYAMNEAIEHDRTDEQDPRDAEIVRLKEQLATAKERLRGYDKTCRHLNWKVRSQFRRHFLPVIAGWQERAKLYQDECKRLKDVIKQHDLCHNRHGKVDAQAFADGCAEEQRKLYGAAPDADKLSILLPALQKIHHGVKDKVDCNESTLDEKIMEIEVRELLEKVELVDEQIRQATEADLGSRE